MQEHGNTVNAHSKGKAGVDFGVYAAIFQNVGIYHPAAHDFQPARTFCYSVICFGFQAPVDVNLCTGFGKGEIGGTQPDFRLAEHFGGEILQGLFQIGKAYALVHIKPFHLVEKAVRPRRNGFVSVNPAGRNGADGRLVVFHIAHLYRGGVRAQQHVGIGLDKKRVLHIARRVIFGQVECGKVVPIVLNFWAFGNVEANAQKDIDDLIFYDGNRMARPQWNHFARTGKVAVNALGLGLGFQGFL